MTTELASVAVDVIVVQVEALLVVVSHRIINAGVYICLHPSVQLNLTFILTAGNTPHSPKAPL